MGWISVRETKYGRYYIVKALLEVRGAKSKKYIVKQSVGSLRKLGSEWSLTRMQMASILNNANLKDWLIRIALFFDPSIDGVREVDADFRPLTQGGRDWALNQIRSFDYRISYDAESCLFRASSLALGVFYLKPKEGVVTFRMPAELKAEMLTLML